MKGGGGRRKERRERAGGESERKQEEEEGRIRVLRAGRGSRTGGVVMALFITAVCGAFELFLRAILLSLPHLPLLPSSSCSPRLLPSFPLLTLSSWVMEPVVCARARK